MTLKIQSIWTEKKNCTFLAGKEKYSTVFPRLDWHSCQTVTSRCGFFVHSKIGIIIMTPDTPLKWYIDAVTPQYILTGVFNSTSWKNFQLLPWPNPKVRNVMVLLCNTFVSSFSADNSALGAMGVRPLRCVGKLYTTMLHKDHLNQSLI